MKEQRNFVRFSDKHTGEDVIVNLNQISLIDLENNKLYFSEAAWAITFTSKDIIPNIAEALRDGI